MYSVADIDVDICGATKCRLCTQFCPESNTIMYDSIRKTAYVSVDRCKGCEICVGICDDLAKHEAIQMLPVDQVVDGFNMSKIGFKDSLVEAK
ncbi:MAG: pyruvate ferredoxin oxidoreductase [Nitrospira sp.]|nr:pyruvate ferredoxin oxidoreductase [Candidatus Manganitrophaceae bacterium]HIL34755.1 pyruvate ferredoxin oxidoreductase [Candidatus Manganitrophaceae bacterium]